MMVMSVDGVRVPVRMVVIVTVRVVVDVPVVRVPVCHRRRATVPPRAVPRLKLKI